MNYIIIPLVLAIGERKKIKGDCIHEYETRIPRK